MKLTKIEKELISARREAEAQKNRVRVLAARFASGDEPPNKLLLAARKLGAYKDCHCHSSYESCWECERCIVFRVRDGFI